MSCACTYTPPLTPRQTPATMCAIGQLCRITYWQACYDVVAHAASASSKGEHAPRATAPAQLPSHPVASSTHDATRWATATCRASEGRGVSKEITYDTPSSRNNTHTRAFANKLSMDKGKSIEYTPQDTTTLPDQGFAQEHDPEQHTTAAGKNMANANNKIIAPRRPIRPTALSSAQH